MAQAFEYYLNPDFNYNTSFQAQLAEYLSAEYMEYINDQNLSVEESAVGFDLNGDGDYDDTIALTIEYDLEKYPETNGYYGTYLDLYLAEFTENLQWYLDNLDYADGWTWFAEDGQKPGTVSEMFGEDIRNGGPDADSSAAAGSNVDSSNYNPLEYVGADDTDDPVWTRVVMGAAEGDQSMFASLNLEIAWLLAGVDCEIEWQWDGGHVPSEIFGESLALAVDEKYGTYVSSVETTKEAATVQTVNGTAEQATGTDISSWVDDSDSDARHWDKFLLNIFENEEYAGGLSGLFNQN